MGGLFIKLGLYIQKTWSKFQCKWNWLLNKLMFKVNSCPQKLCTCKK